MLNISIIDRVYYKLDALCNKIPDYMHPALNFLYFHYFLPAMCGPIKYMRFINFLRRSQWWDRKRLEQYQLVKLKQLLRHAYKNVPYYTNLFMKLHLMPDEITSLADLKKLPLLTKEDIINNFDMLIDKTVKTGSIKIETTSGSTGKPMQCPIDLRYLFTWAAFEQRYCDMMDIDFRHKYISLWSRPFIGKKIENFYLYEPLIRRLSLSTAPHHFSDLDKYLLLIRQFQPYYIRGNPSMLYQLACYAQEKGVNDISFSCFMSSFENIYPYQREVIERQFKCKIFSWYACQERVVSAIECSTHEGMHIEMEKAILEIVGENGENLPDGESGRIIVTAFHNYAMPFIRYEIGDIASISPQICSCGRGLPLLKSFDGRNNEVIQYNRKFVYSATLSVLLSRFTNIKECQFMQEYLDEITIFIVKRQGYTDRDSQELVQALRKIIGEELKVVIQFVTNIPRTRMGKFPLVVSKINHNADKQQF